MVNIIIVTYNGTSWLKKCLDSCGDYPVVVVDNNSSDKTISFIEENYPKVTILPQDENLGFGQANNLGITHALKEGAEHVFLLNQDVYLIDDCLSKLMLFQTKNPKYGVLSPIHFNGSGEELDEKFLLYLNRYKVSGQLLHNCLIGGGEKVYPISFVNAAGWLVSKRCLTTVGGFDPLFFHYGEDRNYCQRVLYHNFIIGIVPNAHMYHDRENRLDVAIIPFSKKYYEEFIRYTKVDWADVNLTDFSSKFEARYKALFLKGVKYLLTFNLKQARNVFIKRKLLEKLAPELLKSREENLKVNTTYLKS